MYIMAPLLSYRDFLCHVGNYISVLKIKQFISRNVTYLLIPTIIENNCLCYNSIVIKTHHKLTYYGGISYGSKDHDVGARQWNLNPSLCEEIQCSSACSVTFFGRFIAKIKLKFVTCFIKMSIWNFILMTRF